MPKITITSDIPALQGEWELHDYVSQGAACGEEETSDSIRVRMTIDLARTQAGSEVKPENQPSNESQNP